MVGIEFKMPVFSQSERFYPVTPPRSEAVQAEAFRKIHWGQASVIRYLHLYRSLIDNSLWLVSLESIFQELCIMSLQEEIEDREYSLMKKM